MFFQYQNVRKFKKDEKTGRTHIIKLQNKEIKVNLHYQSPPKRIKQQQALNTHINAINNNKNVKKIIELKHKKAALLENKQISYFYKMNIQDNKNLNDQYQNFHKAFNKVNQYKQKIKVFSNSKDSKKSRSLNKTYNAKVFNSENRQNCQQIRNVPIRKIILFSPHKKIKGNDQKNGRLGQIFNQTSKKFQKSIKKVELTNSTLLQMTPSKRAYKIEVTTSKKRQGNKNKKNSSFAIYNDQSGKDFKIQKFIAHLRQSNNQIKQHSQSVNLQH